MILVHLSKTWPLVGKGERSAEDVTLKAWAGISDEALDAHGDGVLGIYRGEVVTAFDVTGWSRRPDGRVVFEGAPSKRWGCLVGTPNPGAAWVQGSARPVKYLDTVLLAGGTVPAEQAPEGHRAVLRNYILTVGDACDATLVVPNGGRVTILTTPTE
jgi:hypothetical protein